MKLIDYVLGTIEVLKTGDPKKYKEVRLLSER